MSFYSQMTYARLGPPPEITPEDLARFVERLSATGVLAPRPHPMRAYHLSFGDSIDQDDLTTDPTPVGDGPIVTFEDYAWDIVKCIPELDELAAALHKERGTVYRAWLSLEAIVPDLMPVCYRDPSDDNKQPMCLDSVSFIVGPNISRSLSDAEAQIGWMGLSFHGYGHFYPWTFREARERFETSKLIQRVMHCCEEMWPVEPRKPSEEQIAARKSVPELWLYDEFDRPDGWLWTVSE